MKVISSFLSVMVALLSVNSAIAGVVTLTGTNGKTTTVNTNIEDNNINRTVTYPNGSNSTTNGTFNAIGNGNYNSAVNRTNRFGNTNSYSLEGQITRETNSRQNSGTISGKNGGQTSFVNSGSCTNGSCNGNRSVIFPNGTNRNTSLSGQRLGAGNFNGSATVTSRNGIVRSGTFSRVR